MVSNACNGTLADASLLITERGTCSQVLLTTLLSLLIFKPGCVGLRPTRAWFLEIVSSVNIGVCVCVCVCVCPPPRALKTSHVKGRGH